MPANYIKRNSRPAAAILGALRREKDVRCRIKDAVRPVDARRQKQLGLQLSRF
jgi:hypothetical protein